jgi:two-component system response regulator YesN
LEGLQRLFEHIEAENFPLRQLSPRRKKLLFYELQGTLQKLLEQVQSTSEIFEQQLEKIDSLNPDEAEMSFPLIKSSIISLCNHIKQQKNNKNQSLFESMKSYISENYMDNNLSLRMLADTYKHTESFVSTFFKDQMGITFSEYLERLRLNEACRLLRETDLPVQDLVIRIGYNSDKAFRRAFKREFGVQPTSFRKDANWPLEG